MLTEDAAATRELEVMIDGMSNLVWLAPWGHALWKESVRILTLRCGLRSGGPPVTVLHDGELHGPYIKWHGLRAAKCTLELFCSQLQAKV